MASSSRSSRRLPTSRAPGGSATVVFSSGNWNNRFESALARPAPRPRELDRSAAAELRQDQFGRYRLDAQLYRSGADDDPSGPGTVLRGHGAQEECAGNADAELRH